MSTTQSVERWAELARYSACDIADALLKLKVPSAGFLSDIKPIPRASSASKTSNTKVLAPASTFLMVPKPTPSFPNPSPPPENLPASNLEDPSTPYADHTRSNTIVLISQPAGQSCAVVGGIMALRMQKLGARGIVVDGRVRDLSALRDLGIPVWSKSTSIIGAGAETKFHAKEVPIRVGGKGREVEVRPGDIVMVDEEENGVVVCPRDKVEEVIGLLGGREGEDGMVRKDERVVEWVENGGSVAEGFRRFR